MLGIHIHSINYIRKRFSIATPKKGTSAYLWIFDTIDGVAPSIKKIIYDTYDLLASIKYTMEAEGCIIPDVNNVNKTWKKRRREAWGVKDSNHGEKRVLVLPKDNNYEISREKIAQRCTWRKGNVARVITAAVLL